MGPTFNNLSSIDILSPFINRGVEERSRMAEGSKNFREGMVSLGGAIGDSLKYHERKKIADKYTYIGDEELRGLEEELAGLERRLVIINKQLADIGRSIQATDTKQPLDRYTLDPSFPLGNQDVEIEDEEDSLDNSFPFRITPDNTNKVFPLMNTNP